MIDYKDSLNLNHTAGENASVANAIDIRPIIPALNGSLGEIIQTSRIRCPECKSLIIMSTVTRLDLSGKRHFCSEVDRILHEEKCVAEIQEVIIYYNRYELSAFQLELKMVENGN